MKKTYFLLLTALCALMSLTFTSCDDDDNGITVPTEVASTSGLYILNSGSYGHNNASLYFYNLETKEVEKDVFYSLNNRRLGDTAQDIIVYGSKMYISMYGSQTIEVIDLKGNSLKQINSEGSPRYMTSHAGKVYVTLYDGYVARLDTASLEIEQRIEVGRNPDQLVVANNKLYVANSGGMDYNSPIGYDKTVSVIDISSFTETKKIDVVLNPNKLVTNTQGDVFLASWGNYGDVPYTFQRIDTTTDEVSSIENPANATEMAVLGNTVYVLHSVYGAEWNIFVYDSVNDSLIREQFITDGTEIASPYGISSSSTLDYVFVGESDYSNTGDIYIFRPEGTLVDKVEAGLNPMKVVDVKYPN